MLGLSRMVIISSIDDFDGKLVYICSDGNLVILLEGIFGEDYL